MLGKLLFKNQSRLQLIIAVFGSILGVVFLITSIHYLIRVNEFGEGAEILGPNTLIVQKKVSNSSTLGLSKTDFSDRELEKIKAEPFIEDVQPVVSNNFDISFETADPMVPRFRSDVFIQTIDPEFMDVQPENWDWKEGDEFVPMIMPRDFFVMMNTFMSASGIPQVSDDLVMSIKCKFTLWNDKDKEWVDCRIVGFTNEVSSILVPQSFMEYGNKKYSDGSKQKVTQVMISGKESEFGRVEELLSERGLESKSSQMVVGRLKSIVGTLFGVVLSISIMALILSMLVLIQYMQLLISKNAYEVRTLLRIGYHPKRIIRKFVRYFVIIFGSVCMLSFISFVLLKFAVDLAFKSGGIYIETEFTFWSIFAMVLAFVFFSLTSYLSAKKGIFNEY